MIQHEEIAAEILDDYRFRIVVLITIDGKGRLQISGADTCDQQEDPLTIGLIHRVIEVIKDFLGFGNGKIKSTVH
jgi:hypothetical protein